ncbi:GNAT family N-acetyltransferase [Streptomyces sp. 549]|uniref:GNAT family N-acetyltransferase n=1 Tax=Streptomyces sp. 549 TaxID=3049076 RepID=UPI0024C46DC6|nr:GNAT family N-acetyltransferase [Streptomyces sp. 549]MDK1476484.1 GNAT family N-acetyltransferase [Streptomyces sp. 549]
MEWNVHSAPVDGSAAVSLLRAYYTEIVGRYHGRPAEPHEVSAAMADEPSTDLAPPQGEFLVAYRGEQPVGCAGVRRLEPGVVELARLFVRPEHRGCGGGAVLLAAVERAAHRFGARAVRLDTRRDLVEARALYARNGYVEIPAYHHGPYADHWFEKRLEAQAP